MHGIHTRVRPRAVDNFKKLAIYRDASELLFDDDVAAELAQVRPSAFVRTAQPPTHTE
jgi:hypothetical protein